MTTRHFITGGASGIGRVAATELLDRGHEVTVFDVDEAGLESLPDGIDTYQGDVSDVDRVEEVIEWETFDVLINNAAVGKWGALEDLEPETVREHFAVNVEGLLTATRAALPTLRERSGRIVNVSSVLSHITAPYWGIYSATKHAVKAISHELRMEVEPFDVEVVIVEPGAVTTGFNERARDNVERYLPDSQYADGYREKLAVDSFGGVTPEKAGGVLAKAATTSRPRTKYRVGWQAKVFPRLRVLLPERIWDRVVLRFS